jgi:hypothetical protein
LVTLRRDEQRHAAFEQVEQRLVAQAAIGSLGRVVAGLAELALILARTDESFA